MIYYGIFTIGHITICTYLVICRAIGKERVSTIVAIVTFVVINPAVLVICVWVLELGVNSYWLAFIFQYI